MDTRLRDYLQELSKKNHYPVTFSGDKENVLNRWIATSVNSEKRISEHIDIEESLKGRILTRAEIPFLSKEEIDENWSYYISKYVDSFYQNISPTDVISDINGKSVYSLCNIFCEKEREILVYSGAQVPARQWINGRLVLETTLNYMLRPHLYIVKLNKGSNTFLIEMTPSSGRDSLDYIMMINPLERLLDERNYFVDDELLEDLSSTYAIVPDKVFCNDGKDLKLVVTPNRNNDEDENIDVSIYDYRGERLDSIKAVTSEWFGVKMDQYPEGLLNIKVTGPEENKKSSDIYVFKGDFRKHRDELISRAKNRADIEGNLIAGVTYLWQMVDIDTNILHNPGFYELMTGRLYYPFMEKYAQLQRFVDKEAGSVKKSPLDIFQRSIYLANESEIDDGYIFYSVYFPKGYRPDKKYPLVINAQWGHGMSRYPLVTRYAIKQHFKEAVILNISARGNLNRDYINEIGLINIIADTVKRFNIDRYKICIVGSCTGTMRCFAMSLRFPDLFSAIGGTHATFRLDINNPEYDYLKNIDNVSVLQLVNVEDSRFNCTRVLDAVQRIPKGKYWTFIDFQHDDLDDICNSPKFMRALVEESKEHFPKKIDFTTDEPVFNKSYWLRVESFQDICKKAVIHAEVKDKNSIRISAENIGSIGLLLGAEELGLDRNIEICVNEYKTSIDMDGYMKLLINVSKNGISLNSVPMAKDDFYGEYELIGVDESLLGIKELYLNRCLIVKPDYYKENKARHAKKLFYTLQNPLKERLRAYSFEGIFESELDRNELIANNFVYAANLDSESCLKDALLEETKAEAHPACLRYKDKAYAGDYFALIKCRNPFNRKKHALLLLCSGETLDNELLNFLSSFDSNALFYSDAVIYNNGEYDWFRSSDA